MLSRLIKNIVFLVLALLIGETITFTQKRTLLDPTGPYAVGRSIFRWVDTSRPEVMTDNSTDSREVITLIWYPAVPNSGTEAVYIPDYSSISTVMAQSGELKNWEVFGLRYLHLNERLNAAPFRDQSSYPVILLSPGNGTNVEFYSSIAGEIASHGYIVVGINHPYDVPAVKLSNGDIAPYNKDQWLLAAEEHQKYTAERIKVRTADLLFVLDRLKSENENAESPFAGLFDLNNIAAAGHSIGGITASEACKADSRFKACLNFDGIQMGGPFSTEASAIPPQQPFLFLTKESQLHPHFIDSFESTVESYWVIIHDAAHDNFTDGPFLRSALSPLPGKADQYLKLINQYSLAFLDQTLKEQSSSLLSANSDSTDITVHVYP